MCSQAEVRVAIKDVLNEVDREGETIIGHEINLKADRIISKLTVRFGIAFISLVISMLGAWYSQSSQVEKNTEAIQRNSTAMNEGGRYTQEERDVDKAYQDAINARIEKKLDEILKELRS